MTDQQIIDAAKSAGLCIPSCWGLEYSSADAAEDLDWIKSAPDGAQMKERQFIFDMSHRRRDEQMAKLRAFAVSIRALPS